MRPALRACATSVLKSPCRPQNTRTAHGLLVRQHGLRYQSDNSSKQPAFPFEGYYEDMLDAPLHSIQPATRTAPAPPPPDELPKTEKEEVLAKARVVFGSRLAGPAERREQIDKLSQNIAGVIVPPRPEEPDNCCMSGCVNCVWDRYRDELEEWAEKSAEARVKLQEQRKKGHITGMVAKETGMPGHAAISMDEDGGGSEASWAGLEPESGQDLFADIPVGIREFMKTEKRLKLKHQREGTQMG